MQKKQQLGILNIKMSA